MSCYSEDTIKLVLAGMLEQLPAETRSRVESEVNDAGFRLWEKHHVNKPMHVEPRELGLVHGACQVVKVHHYMCVDEDNCNC